MTRSTKAPGKGRKLSNFLCFAVYSANLAFGRAYKPILDAVGLTYTQYIAMVALSEEDKQIVSVLGEKLFLESNTLTPILKKLEQLGYIRRQRDPADERQVRLSLTQAGRRQIEKDLGESLIDAIGLGEELPVVQQTVSRLRDNLLRNTGPERMIRPLANRNKPREENELAKMSSHGHEHVGSRTSRSSSSQ